MKQLVNWGLSKYLLVMMLLTLAQSIAWSLDEGGSSTTTSTHVSTTSGQNSNWYASPWVWVVGAAILILLIVALSSSGRRSDGGRTDKVTVTKTVTRDTDTDAV